MSPITTTARTGTLVFIFVFITKILSAQSNCASALDLTPSTTCSVATGDLQGAINATPTGACGGATSTTTNGVWYKFTATSTNATITVNNLGTNLTTTTTYLEILNGTCVTSFTSIACQDVSTSLNLTSLVVNTVYYVRIYVTGSTTSGGNPNKRGFDICLITSPNDECASAATLPSGTSCSNTAGTVVSATASSGVPAGCQAGTHYDVWYKFVATSSTHTASISSQGASFTNPEIQLFSGACGSLTSIACNTTSVSSSSLTSGSTYYIRVSNVGSSPGSNGGFNICVTHPAPPVIVKGGRMNEVYKQTTLSGSGILQYPWEVTYGPDDKLWITEARGYKVYRMDPNTGAKTTVLDLNSASTDLSAWGADSLRAVNLTSTNNWNATANNWPQGGLAGLALHPNFMDGSGLYDFVYISYVHRFLYTVSGSGGIFFRNKIVRFTYNSVTQKLGSPVAVCDDIPGGQDHNSQRMIIAPVTPGGPYYLFYAAGDMGAGQYANRLRAQNAQNPASYEGKILRFNLEPDGGAGAEAWIPDDNPYSATSAVWSIGIRNNQGFAYNPVTNKLYGASHGPYSDDEINIIEGAKNYGHPLVIGFASDGNANNTSAGAPLSDNSGVSTCPIITSESANAAAIGSSYKDPLFSSYPNSVAFPSIYNLWSTTTGANAQWPTEAWSGLDIYTKTLIPGWKNSLVAASLKWGRLVKLKLNSAGTATMPNNSVSDTITYFNSQNRFRDMAFSPDGKDIFVIMDNSSTTSGPGSANPVVPNCAGCVQKYTFLGYYDNSGKSSIPTSIDVTDAPVNTCNTGTTITIDNNNNNLWVPITGPDGNIMAEIFANGNNLGTVTSSFYKNSGAIRVAGTTHYLDRNMTITPQTQPSSTVKIRLYLSKAELDALIADGASNVTAISNLKIYKNNDPCSSVISAAPTEIIPTYAEAHGANGYMLQGDITSFSSFYFAANTFTTLPLDLLSFTGHLQNDNSVLLTWKTENEINTSYFIVERSIDGSRFNSIRNVSALGGRNNQGGSFNYSITDEDAVNQSSSKLYYRLKMVDIDGSFKYSNIVFVSIPFITNKVTISPNPVLTAVKVAITSEADGRVQWKLTDNVGRVIQKGSEYVKKGAGNNFAINMNRLPTGTYNLNVKGAGLDQNVQLQKR